MKEKWTHQKGALAPKHDELNKLLVKRFYQRRILPTVSPFFEGLHI